MNDSVRAHNKIVIGRDTRPSGVFLHQLIVGTCLAAGVHVVDLGIVPTPSVKLMVTHCNASGGIMISASHNPLDWNGFKFLARDGSFFDQSQQKQWHKALKADILRPSASKFNLGKLRFANKKMMFYRTTPKLGRYDRADAIQAHITAILKYITNSKAIREQKYKVVVDGVNGAGSQALPLLLEQLGCQVSRLYCEPKLNSSSRVGNKIRTTYHAMPTFPRPPEPNAIALRQLAQHVKKNKAAIGFALDPDADRLALATPQQGAISEEYTLALALFGMAEQMQTNKSRAARHNLNTIVVNLSTSRLCEYFCERYDMRIYRSAVGEANVVALMRQKNAIFGGEGNGGVIVPAIPSYGRDPLIAAALILSAMAERVALTVDTLLEHLPPLFMQKKQYTMSKEKFALLADRLRLEFAESKVNTSDGLHLSLDDKSWLHLRPSNTEPILRLIAQAPSAARLKQIMTLAHGALKKC